MVRTSPKPWWQPLGVLLDRYQLPMLDPFAPDYPAWTQADRAVLLIEPPTGNRLVTTDGLGGAELPEYAMETSEQPDRLNGHWATNLMLELGRYLPGNADEVAELIDRHGPVTLSLELDGVPADWQVGDSQVGLLLGLPQPHLQADRVVTNVLLLRPAELQYCLDHGSAGRTRLLALLGARELGTVSDLERPSVV